MVTIRRKTMYDLLHRLTVSVLVALILFALMPISAAQAASLVVNTLDDELNSDGDCSLREAITAANTNTATDACPAGSAGEGDIITFSVGGAVVLGSMLPNVTDPAGLTIDGMGQTVTISGNRAVKVMQVDWCATLELRDLIIVDGYTGVGTAGGIKNFGRLTVTGSSFSGHRPEAITSGGNPDHPGVVEITNSSFSNNTYAVSVHFDTAHILNSTFSNNGPGPGAAIANDRATMTIVRSTFTDNDGSKWGAVTTWSGSLTITDSLFSGNRALDYVGTAVGGGAIVSDGTVLAIANSTFVNNVASGMYGAGGGAISVNGGTASVTNSTLVGNRAYAWNAYYSGEGGAIYVYGGAGSVDITNSTFLDNYALEEGSSGTKGDGGDAVKNADTRMIVTLRNTLVARYIPEQETRSGWPVAPLLNCSGPITDGGGNLNFNNWNATDSTCPGLNIDPLLDPAGLQDNGGPTPTVALLPGSPAIAAGDGGTCTATPVDGLDQRGALRTACDIGAFAYGSTPPPVSDPDPLPPLQWQSGCTPINRPPVVTNPGNQTSAEGSAVTLQIVAGDPDGDALTFSAVGLPPGLGINAAGLISGALGYDAAGVYTLTVTVTDGNGGSAGASFTWTVTDINRPPTLAPIGDKTVTADTLLSFALNASDPDGDLLTYSATGLPAGAVLDASSGAFSWVPSARQVGVYPTTFSVTDSGGLSASQSITITVTAGAAQNRDPVCTAALPSVAEIWPPKHRMVPIEVLGVMDPDGDPVTITIAQILQDEPTDTLGDGTTWTDGFGVGTSVAQVRAERTGTPRVPGNGRVYEIRFHAADGQGGSCTGAVMIGVPHDQGHGPAIDDGIRYDSTVAGGRV